GWTDHDDVLRHDLCRQFGRELLPAHAVAPRDGHRALGGVLADNEFIEFGNNLARREFVEREFLLFLGPREVNRHCLCFSYVLSVKQRGRWRTGLRVGRPVNQYSLSVVSKTAGFVAIVCFSAFTEN